MGILATTDVVADMAILGTLLAAVLGILLYFYLNQQKLVSEENMIVVNETYDFIIGKNILLCTCN